MIKNEINAHNATLLSNQGKAENLKRCLEEVYTEIKKQALKGDKYLIFYSLYPTYRGNNDYTGEVIWVITNILMSQGYSVEINKDNIGYFHLFIKW